VDQSELALHPHHLGVPSVRPKCCMHIRCKPCTNLVPRLTISPNVPKWASIWPRHLGGPIGVAKRFPSPWYIWCKLCPYLGTRLTLSPNGSSVLLLDPRHQEVPSGAPKMISESIARSAQNVPLSWVTISKTDRNELLFDPNHLGVTSGVPKTIFKPMVCSSQTIHLSCIEINTIAKCTEMSFYLTHVT
jgi:hypothetical protein